MPKHTLGPWKAGRPDMSTIVDGVDCKYIYCGPQEKGKSHYVAIAHGEGGKSWETTYANALLIAAAPQLLEALKELADAVEWHLDVRSIREAESKARAAIAAAEGEG